jgi:hypothetical protein
MSKKENNLDEILRGARAIHEAAQAEGLPFTYPQVQRGLRLGRIDADLYGTVYHSTRRRVRRLAQQLRGEAETV